MNNKKSNLDLLAKWGAFTGFAFAILSILTFLGSCSVSPTILTSTPSVIPARHYYVNGNQGSDSNPGSQTAPWQTIQKAADSARAGDSIMVLPGTYAERVQVTHSGADNASISFLADGAVSMQGFTIKADYITVKGFEITNTPDAEENGIGIFVRGSYCAIEDNYIHFATRGGIMLYANPGAYTETSHCIVRNNRLYQNSQSGIEVHGRDQLVEGNEIWGTIQYHPTWINPPDWLDADGIRFFGSGHIIRKNYIHDIRYGVPENRNPHIDCFQTWSDKNHEAASNIVIEKNRCENAQAQSPEESGTGLMIQNSTGALLIRNNIINAFVNVYLANDNDVSILNNTFTSDPNLNTEFDPVGVSINHSANIYLENNIFYNLPGHIVYVKGDGVFSGKNLAYRGDGKELYSTATYDPSNDFWNVDPLFVDAATGDYHLKITSPAVDAGVTLKDVSDDYDGNSRPQGKSFDIGAYEWSPTP